MPTVNACRVDPAPDYMPAPTPANEAERLADVRRLGLLDSEPEERFDRISRLATKVFEAPISYVALVDEDRQWFKTRVGMEPQETPRESSFCGHAIMQDQAMVIQDARKDLRFAGNPLVIGEPFVRFYAGQPLRGPGGFKVGTLCVLDRRAREFSAKELDLLRELATMVEDEMAVQSKLAAQAAALLAQQALADSERELALRRARVARGQAARG
jgi:GAF domain-containing protein